MPTAKRSHNSGLLKFGQIDIWFGSGNIQKTTHGRPTWMPGKMSVQMTANSVIASEKRLIAVRHFCRNRKRTALMSVPAWPIPIHQTKLVMSHAQYVGEVFPQTPTPRQKR